MERKKLNQFFKTSLIASIDRYTIDHEPVRSIDLMERAASVWVEQFSDVFGFCRRVAVVAGWGNNGGDGYAIARILYEKGLETIVYQLAMEPKAMTPDCEANLIRYRQSEGELVEIRQEADFDPPKNAVIIDAIFGAGLNRRVEGLPAEIIRKINSSGNRVAAVDIPSGLFGEDNTGNDPATIVRADYTFTFQFPKLAFMLSENDRYIGEWRILDIGLHPDAIRQQPTDYYYLTSEAVAGLLPKPFKFAHKGINGRGALIAGSYAMMGAAVLAARAAVRSGIGLLHCHVPGAGCSLIQMAVPEALADPDRSERLFSAIDNVGQYDAIAIGPAIGRHPDTVAGLKKLLTEWHGTTILDADALNIMADYRELLDMLHEKCILTPHIKEFERLAGKCVNDFDRLNKLSTFVKQYGVCMILKGAHTVITSPDGKFYFNMSGNPGMAKGGAGDVLTGILLALAANDMAPLDAAIVGVYAHGLSGDIAMKTYGMRGVCAGVIADDIGKAWRKLEIESFGL